MEDFLYSEKDFSANRFRLLFTPHFNIYQNRIVIIIPVSDNGNLDLDISVFLPKNIQSVLIKKSFFGSYYRVFLKLDGKKYFNGTPFPSDTILIANKLNKENADKLQAVLLNVKKGKNISTVGHSFTESIEYMYKEQQERVKKFSSNMDGSMLPMTKWLFSGSIGLTIVIGIIALLIISSLH